MSVFINNFFTPFKLLTMLIISTVENIITKCGIYVHGIVNYCSGDNNDNINSQNHVNSHGTSSWVQLKYYVHSWNILPYKKFANGSYCANVLLNLVSLNKWHKVASECSMHEYLHTAHMLQHKPSWVGHLLLTLKKCLAAALILFLLKYILSVKLHEWPSLLIIFYVASL